MINTTALNRLIIYKNMNIINVANCIGKSYSSTYLKINGKIAMTLNEAEKIQQLLEIDDQDFGFYFLNNECAI